MNVRDLARFPPFHHRVNVDFLVSSSLFEFRACHTASMLNSGALLPARAKMKLGVSRVRTCDILDTLILCLKLESDTLPLSYNSEFGSHILASNISTFVVVTNNGGRRTSGVCTFLRYFFVTYCTFLLRHVIVADRSSSGEFKTCD